MNNYEQFQFDFHPHYCTEIAPEKKINDLRMAADSGILAILVFLNCSVAPFYTIDHNILLNR